MAAASEIRRGRPGLRAFGSTMKPSLNGHVWRDDRRMGQWPERWLRPYSSTYCTRTPEARSFKIQARVLLRLRWLPPSLFPRLPTARVSSLKVPKVRRTGLV